MDYEDFLRGIMWTKKQWAHDQQKRKIPTKFHYEALRGRGEDYWLHIERMDETKVGEEIITGFLNTAEWSCHLDKPSSDKGKEMVHQLKAAVDQLPSCYNALKGYKIEDVDFQGKTVVERKEVSILSVIATIYAKFREIKFVKFRDTTLRFGPVPTSKLMHMALPNLFVMWDNAIFKKYRVPSDIFGEHSYIAFLLLMQENIRHIKETHPVYSDQRNCDIVKRMNIRCGYENLPMTRLIDIANYAVGHLEEGAPDIKCHKCKKKTNQRLNKLEHVPYLAELMKTLRIIQYR